MVIPSSPFWSFLLKTEPIGQQLNWALVLLLLWSRLVLCRLQIHPGMTHYYLVFCAGFGILAGSFHVSGPLLLVSSPAHLCHSGFSLHPLASLRGETPVACYSPILVQLQSQAGPMYSGFWNRISQHFFPCLT